MTPRLRRLWILPLLGASLALAGCSDFLGIDEFADETLVPGAGDVDDRDPQADPIPEIEATGALLWWSAFGDAENDGATTVERVGEQLQIAGTAGSPIDLGGGPVASEGMHGFVGRLSLEGDHAWSVGTSGTGNVLELLATGTTTDGAAVVGHYQGAVTIGTDDLPDVERGIFVAWLDNEGAVTQVVSYPVMGALELGAVATSSAGQVAVVGAVSGSVDVPGSPIEGTFGNFDALLLVLDQNGMVELASNLRVENDGSPQRLVAATFDEDSLWIGGTFSGGIDLGNVNALGTSDAVVAQIDPQTGDTQNILQLGGGSTVATIASIGIGPNGPVVGGSFTNRIIVGDSELDSAGGSDLFFAALGEDLEPAWAMRLGGVGDQKICAVEADADGNVVLAGGFTGNLGFAIPEGELPEAQQTETLTSMGEEDIFIAKTSPDGEPLWLRGCGREGSDTASGLALLETGEVLVAGHFESGLSLDGELLKSHGMRDAFIAELDR